MKKFTVSIALMFCFFVAFSQDRFEKTPLCNFFQQNFDSTIVMIDDDNINDFQIIAKFENIVYLFYYRNPYKWTNGYVFPGKLTYKFMDENSAFRKTVPDTNRYFMPLRMSSEKRNQFWLRITKMDQWNLESDHGARDTCQKKDLPWNAGSLTYCLITKNQVRTVYFDGPWDREEHCPGNKNRHAAIAILEIFKLAFQSL